MADFRFLARRLKPALTGIACAIIVSLTAPAFAQQAGQALMPWDVANSHPVLAGLWRMTPAAVERHLRDNLRALGFLSGTA